MAEQPITHHWKRKTKRNGNLGDCSETVYMLSYIYVSLSLTFINQCQPSIHLNHPSVSLIPSHTEKALVKVTIELLLALDKVFVSVLVLSELGAGFDTIPHDILRQRPKHLIGISGTALNWFKSLFTMNPLYAPKLVTEFYKVHAWANTIYLIHASLR